MAAAKPRRPMKKTQRQKRLEDLSEVQGIVADMIGVMDVVDVLMVEVEVPPGGFMVELLILNPVNMGLSL